MHTAYINLRFTTLVCAYIACTAIAMTAMPGAPVLSSLVGFTFVTVAVTATYRNLRSHSTAGEIGLFVAAMLMTVGVIANVYYFTTISHGTCESPVLQNYDANLLWNSINASYGIGDGYVPTRGIYSVINAALMCVFGHSIVTLLIFNMYCLLSALLLCSLIAHNLTGDHRTAGYSLCATAAVCYLLSMGTVLLRDAWVILGMAMAGYGITSPRKYGWISTVCGGLLVAATRTNWVLAIVIGLVIMLFAEERNCRRYTKTAALISAMLVMWCIPTIYGMTTRVDAAFNAESLNTYYHYSHPQQQAFYAIVGNYYDFSIFKKILYLPITIAVQFLIPFPWNFMRDSIFGYTQIYAHVAYPWYAFAGLVLFFMYKASRESSRKLTLFTVWAAICWAIPCLLFGGTVSRYGLSAIILLAPSAGVVIRHHLRSRAFKRFSLLYLICLTLTIPLCYIIQNHVTI